MEFRRHYVRETWAYSRHLARGRQDRDAFNGDIVFPEGTVTAHAALGRPEAVLTRAWHPPGLQAVTSPASPGPPPLQSCRELPKASDEIEEFRRRLTILEVENARLKAGRAVDLPGARRSKPRWPTARSATASFNSIDEGFCIIEFFDGPEGPLSDYVHVEANPAYALDAGIPDVVGQKLREMVPAEADGWAELYGGVLRTGVPIRFERELVATGRHLELAAFRIEPESRRQGAVLFQDITARKRAETALHELNETLEQRVAEAICRAQAGGGSAAPGAEDGGGRPAHRRHRARLQQSAARASSARSSCCRRACARDG